MPSFSSFPSAVFDIFVCLVIFAPFRSLFRSFPSLSSFFRQLREELRRKAQQLSRLEEDSKLSLDKAWREVSRKQHAVKGEEEQVQNLRRETERALAEARDGRDKVELERGEMLRGFQEVKMALEVRVEDRGQGQCCLRGRTWSES